MVTTANVITYLISGFAVLLTIYNLVKSSTKEDSTAMTEVRGDVKSIKETVMDIKSEVISSRQEVRNLDRRLTAVETILKIKGGDFEDE